ncbi:MAG TPA: glycoside hydrolase family 3 N-terminal domain-containing protein [Solirubrobacteraceae bacterium]|nr:glycoside hydrolase family 3 N-terminal domain-containing protein [Solirubrobacteraceae bacterium]
MRLRVPGREEAAEEPFDLETLEWAPPPPRRRWRRIWLAVPVVVLVVAAGAVAWSATRRVTAEVAPLSTREQAQIEAAAPGISRQGAGASLPLPAPARRAAAALPLHRAVAQLFVVGVGEEPLKDVSRVRARRWGGVTLAPGRAVDPGTAAGLTAELVRVSRPGIPPLVAAEQIGGPASTFPGFPPRAQPLVGDGGTPRTVRAEARRAARALRELGVRMTLAPVADVGVAAGPLQDRVFSDDPRIVARLTAAAVEGWRAGGVIPAVGHFPGQGSASEDPDVANSTVGLSLRELRARDLRPFAAVVRRAPVIVMSNAVFAAFDGVTPATALPDAMSLLRRDLRYRGAIMTGDLAATAPVLGTGVAGAAVQALEAGADMLYVGGRPDQQAAAYAAVLRAVRTRQISRTRLDLSVQRVMALKLSVGLLPAPRRPRGAKAPRVGGSGPRSPAPR